MLSRRGIRTAENYGTKESDASHHLTPGDMVTVTRNSKGEATYILVTSTGGFGGFCGGRGQSQG